jgi:hypothetical protein
MNFIKKYKNIFILHFLSLIFLNICFLLELIGNDINYKLLISINLLYLLISMPISIFVNSRFFPELIKEKNILLFFMRNIKKAPKILDVVILIVIIVSFYKVFKSPSLTTLIEEVILPFNYLMLVTFVLSTFGAPFWGNKES